MERSIRRSPVLGAALALALLAGTLVGLAAAPADAAIPYPDTERISVGDAVSAGIAVSKRMYAADAAGAVVLTRDDKFPDGLAASALAGEKNAPVLFTPSNRLVAATKAEIDRVLVAGARVYLMGGPAALDPSIDTELRNAGYDPIRVQGDDRNETAANAARFIVGPGPGNTALLVRGRGNPGQDNTQGWPDAISCGGYAASTETPIVLTNPNKPELPKATVDALKAMNIQRVLICGGPAAVPNEHAGQLVAMNIAVSRYAGDTRVTTAVDVARRLWNKGSSTNADDFILINGWGENYAYGIAAAPLSGATSAPMLLVNTNDPDTWPIDCGNPPTINSATACYLNGDGNDRVASLTVIGSTSVITDKVFEAAAKAAGLPKDTKAPTVPTDVKATDTPEDDGTQLTVTWTKSTDDTSSDITYTVYHRQSSADDFDKAAATKSGTVKNATTFTIKNLTKGQSYDVAVTATDSFGNTSAVSASASATPSDETPAAPKNAPNVANQPGPAVVVSWLAGPEADVAGYKIERATPGSISGDCTSGNLPQGGASYSVIASVQGRDVTSYRDEDVTQGGEYCYRYRKVDTTGNDSGASPFAAITVNEVSSDQTPPAGTPTIYAVNFDQEEGLIDGSSAASRTEKSTNRIDVIVPAGAFQNGEAGKVIIYDGDDARVEQGFVGTGGEQVVSASIAFQTDERTAEITVTLADAGGNESAPSAAWSLQIDPQAPTTPRIISVDGVDTDPLTHTNAKIPVVGGSAPRVDQTPTIVVTGLTTQTAQAQRIDIFHQGVAVASDCWDRDPETGNGPPPEDGRAVFTNVAMVTGTNNLVAVLTTRTRCGGFGTQTTARSGDSNTVKYVFNAASFGVTSSNPGAGESDEFGFKGETFTVTFNKPAAVGSSVELRRPGSTTAVAEGTVVGAASATITLNDPAPPSPLPAGPWEYHVSAVADDNASQSTNTVISFNSGFIHLVHTSAAVSPTTSEPNNTGDVDDQNTPFPITETDYNLTYVVTSQAPTGRYYVYNKSTGSELDAFDHFAGSETRRGDRSLDPADFDDASTEGFEWAWRKCIPDSEDPGKNCDTLEVSDTAGTTLTGKQYDGALPKASIVPVGSVALRQGAGNSFFFAGVDSLPTNPGYAYEVLYRPTIITSERGGDVFETTFQGPEQVIRKRDGSTGVVDNASVRPGYEVRYFVRNLDNGNESAIVMDGKLRGLTNVFPTNGIANTEGQLEANDSLVLEFANVSFSTVTDDNTRDGGMQVFTGSGDNVKEVEPRFDSATGASSASRDFARENRFVITFGSATTLGGAAIPQAVSAPTQVHGGLSWFGLNWALDKSTYIGRDLETAGALADHAVLLPPSDQPRSVNTTF